MKLLAIVLTMALTSSTVFSNIQEIGYAKVYQQENKKQIDKEELPEVVMTEFNKSVYQEWAIEKVFMIGTGEEVSYELHLTQQDEKMVVLADANGHLQPKADS